MSLLNWIFGEKKNNNSSKDEVNVENEDSVQDEIEGNKIKEVKKKSTVIKNEEGYMASVKFVTAYIQENEINFNSYLSLIKKIAPYMAKAEEFSESDFLLFMNENNARFPESESIENYIKIAHLFRKFNVHLGIKYLEKCCTILPPAQAGNVKHFDVYLTLGEYYMDNGQGEDAFLCLRKANLVNTNFNDPFYHIANHINIKRLEIRIYAKGYTQPQHMEVISSTTCLIILQLTNDLFWSPDSFLRIKERCQKRNEYLFENHQDFQNAIQALNAHQNMTSFYREINHYIFFMLPAKYRVPESYWKFETLDDFYKARTKEREDRVTFEEDPEEYMRLVRKNHDQKSASDYYLNNINMTVFLEDVKQIMRRTLVK